MSNINNAQAWGGYHGKKRAQDWAPPNETGGIQFYVKWINFYDRPYILIKDMHHRLFSHNILGYNDPKYIFTQATLVHLYITNCITERDVYKVYSKTYQRLGDTIHSHEELYQKLNCNLSQIVLVSELLKMNKRWINEELRKAHSNDKYIMAVLRGSVIVPEWCSNWGEPYASETYKFITKLIKNVH